MINVYAILACGVLSVILGSLWYGPLFGKTWMRLTGLKKPEKMTPEIKHMMMKSYSFMILASLVMAFVLSNEIAYFQLSFAKVGVVPPMIFAFFQWLGFVMPATIGSVLWEGKSKQLWVINAGYTLVQMILMALLLSLWQ